MRKKIMPYLLCLPQLLLMVLFLIGLGTGIIQSLGVIPAFGLEEVTLRYYREALTRPELLRSVWYSLRIAFLSAAGATAGGVLLCAVLVMRGWTRGAGMRVMQLPIIVPHVVAALFAVQVCSQNGILARLAFALGMIEEQQEFPMILYHSDGRGIILAYLWKEIPFIVYFVIALMANINGKLGEAAVNLGAGVWRAFWSVTLPLCRNTILSGFLILFVFALGAYELPAILGATAPKALPVLAYEQYTHPDLRNRPYSMALNGIILVISLVSAAAYFWLMEKNTKELSGNGGSL